MFLSVFSFSTPSHDVPALYPPRIILIASGVVASNDAGNCAANKSPDGLLQASANGASDLQLR